MQWERACALLSEMKENAVEPNAISYCAAISACEQCDQQDRASQLYLEAVRFKHFPEKQSPVDFHSYPSDVAKAALRTLKENAVEPNAISYCAAISACEQCD